MNVLAVLEKMEGFTSIVMSVQDVSSIHGNIVLHVSDVLFRIIVAIAKKRSKKCEIKVRLSKECVERGGQDDDDARDPALIKFSQLVRNKAFRRNSSSGRKQRRVKKANFSGTKQQFVISCRFTNCIECVTGYRGIE